MLSFKVIGCGAAGNKAVLKLAEYGYDKERIILLNSTNRDIPSNADPSIKTILFGEGLGGCGKERPLGKKMLLNSLQNTEEYDSLVNPSDQAIVLVGSTEGGSGSASIPILAKYFSEVHGVNVICVLFFGFGDDARGLQNSIEICQELTEDVGVIAISNAKFLDDVNGNRFKAEQAANDEFVNIIKILCGSTIMEGPQVIDDTDLYKVVTTPGYMMVGSLTTKEPKSSDDFDDKLKCYVSHTKFVDPPKNPGMKREALIFNVPENFDEVDYNAKPISDLLGIPYERFTNLSYNNEDSGSRQVTLDFIVSGMKMPIEEITDIYNSYMANSSKVDKSKDNFFNNLREMIGDENDKQFNMMGTAKKPKSDKGSFFSNMGTVPVTETKPPVIQNKKAETINRIRAENNGVETVKPKESNDTEY